MTDTGSTLHDDTEPDRYKVIVIGAGQAGLAIGYHLRRQGRRFVILDAADQPAAAWRDRWDSLRLFTPVRHNSLPGLAFPGDPDHYPTRDQVVDYLTRYAEHFGLPVQLSSRVERLRALDGGGFTVEIAGGRTLEADQVVVATGPFQEPAVPPIATHLAPEVVQMHSTAYRRPDDLPVGPVLVVGGGNTGYQIAQELVRTRPTHLAVGSRQTPLPQRIFGRDLFGYLERTGLMAKNVDGRLAQRLKDRETLIGSSPRAARRAGIQLHGRVISAGGRSVTFQDGSSLDVDGVVWATGFRLDHSWVDAPVFDTNRRLVHRRGVTEARGLFFLGLPWQYTRGSALLGWVKDDAAYIAAQIADDAKTRSVTEPAVAT